MNTRMFDFVSSLLMAFKTKLTYTFHAISLYPPLGFAQQHPVHAPHLVFQVV